MPEDYRLSSNGVFRIDKQMHIPNDINNKHWARYLDWVSEGNTAKPQYSLEQRRINRWREVQVKCMESCNGGILVGSKVLDSNEDKKNKYNSYISDIDRGWTEVEFTLINNDDTINVLDVVELNTTHTKTTSLYNLAYKNAALLKGNIDISDNPEAVDIDAGWPVTPFNG